MAEQQHPHHIAIIPDGNRRWTKEHRLDLLEGYKKGVEKVQDVCEWCVAHHIQTLTFFTFSNENWKRGSLETQVVMKVISESLKGRIPFLIKEGIKLSVIGDRDRLATSLKREIERGEEETSMNEKLHLRLAISYGGRWEIAHAVREVIQEEDVSEMTDEDIEKRLDERISRPQPLDMIIRTGGEKRLSNFLLWQSAYTELYFSDTLWPDFSQEDFLDALSSFRSRQRRFGT